MTLKTFSRWLANSPPLRRGRALLEKNQANWNLPMSKLEKLQVGVYLILSDFAEGKFPPAFEDQRSTYDGEIHFRRSTGVDPVTLSEWELRKPYWFGSAARHYLHGLTTILHEFERLGIAPPQKLLELGSGTGWMAEVFARFGFDVWGTSIAPDEVMDARRRIEGIRSIGLRCNLEFRVAPMETVHEHVADRAPFDAVFVFEALHHAHSWEDTFRSAFQCLRPRGWFIIAAEPNLLHTFISYRVGKLSNTHEIGLSASKMRRHLRAVGFSKVITLRNRPHFFYRTHWIAAQR